VALLFFIDLPLILYFVLSELCHEYIMKFTFVTFPCRRSGCGRACRKVCWFLIRLPENFTLRIRGLFDDFMHQGESNPPGLSKWFILQLLQFLKCKNKARGLELPYEIRLPVEVYECVRVARTSSPSVTSLSRACSFVSVSLCFIFQFGRRQYLMMFKLVLCSIFRRQNLN